MRQRTFDNIISLWIYSIGFLSAYINMSTLLHYTYAVSHCTNNFVSIFYDATQRQYFKTETLIMICALFILGGTLASLVNRGQEFSIRHYYGHVQILTGVWILACYIIIGMHDELFTAAMSLIMGVQNALIYSYRGVSFKPSHLTTTFSNLGQYIGEFFMRKPESRRNINFELSLVSAFALGTAASLVTYNTISGKAYILAGAVYIALGMFFIILRRVTTRE